MGVAAKEVGTTDDTTLQNRKRAEQEFPAQVVVLVSQKFRTGGSGFRKERHDPDELKQKNGKQNFEAKDGTDFQVLSTVCRQVHFHPAPSSLMSGRGSGAFRSGLHC